VEEKMSRRRMDEMVEMDPLKGLQSNLCFEDECVAIMNSGWCTHLVDKDVEKAQGTSQAAISPLHQEQQKMCCWNI
jgi:hypothetical protein